MLAILQHVSLYTATLGQQGYADTAFTFLEKIVEGLTDVLIQSDVTSKDDTGLRIAIAESIAAMPIELSLATRKRFHSFRRANVARQIRRISWRNQHALYRVGFEDYAVGQLEWLAPKIAFELAVEGREISPPWYTMELVLKPEAERFVANVDILSDRLTKLYSLIQKKFADANLHWMAAAIVSRHWEFWHKLNEQMGVWTRTWEEINADRKLKKLPWPVFDIGAVASSIASDRKTILTVMAQLQRSIGSLDRPENYPDYAGQFLHVSGEAALSALIDGDSDLFREVFPLYFSGCLVRFDKLRPTEGPDWLVERNLRIASGALWDLMDISGYALLFAEFHKINDLWRTVHSTWDIYFGVDKENRRLAVIAAMINIVESGLGMQHRGILRTTWLQTVAHKLDELPRDRSEIDTWRYVDDRSVIHESPLVREVASRAHSLDYDGVDIFIALYLARRERAESLTKHWKRRDLAEELQHVKFDIDVPTQGDEQA